MLSMGLVQHVNRHNLLNPSHRPISLQWTAVSPNRLATSCAAIVPVQVIKKRQGEFLAFSQKIGSVLSIPAPDYRVNELKCYKGSQFIFLKQLAESYPEEAMLYYQQVKASVEVRCRFKRNRKNSEVPPHTNLKTSRK
jgi:hypothetical protein